ncbi:unnamed protein product [Fraxinus pennsylvanica]|uniref:Uncharacterized protein n=1 Tax=Fraxinus pennsylvanica TaxID=56036 RepID=A0AAD1Z857_9LAMI|nr:unnamed protein product [Fraxinus pennsylvanica]
MEVEMEPRVKPLAYKVKAMSRESTAQKATHVLDTDLRNHWSTGTNTKEWILLELDEPCLLSHIRIYNKSVLEWEISVGLRYKPETFVKVRPRCEAPRRDMIYPMNYSPCRYVRISCMRGNPIAIFFVQLIGVPVTGLEPEFQSVASYLIPHIISHKQDARDMHLQLLQDVTSRLVKFLPYIETDLNNFPEDPESTMRFLAMVAGPFYPILHIVNERENERLAANISDYEASKTNPLSTALTVSSNFEPRRSRNTSSMFLAKSSHLVFRPEAVFTLLRKAYKDSSLGNLCRLASRILLKLIEPMTMQEASDPASEISSSVAEEAMPSETCGHVSLNDYSNLFGEEFQMLDDHWDTIYLSVLDSGAVEEGILHVLYACASQPLLCGKLADRTSDFWSALPLIQALLPALRPTISSPYQIDDNFSPWKQQFVQNALSQIVATSSSSIYHPLLRACAGYLSSFSPSHAKAACVLIDLCSGVLAPWMAQVIAKVDLTLELLEDLLGDIQGVRHSFSRARAALKYIVLALSGNMDDIMAKYKDAKHRILFLMEMLEPFLDPALTPLKAIRKSAVLPSLEAEWRRGSVAPSVLLSILEPQMQLPPDIDHCKFSGPETLEQQSFAVLPPASRNGLASSRSNSQDDADGKVDVADINGKMDIPEDVSLLFAPPELNRMSLTHVRGSLDMKRSESSCFSASPEVNHVVQKDLCKKIPNDVALDAAQGLFSNLLGDYSQLLNYRDCELRASEFRRLALDLHSQNEITVESHDAAIDALLLAAECYINPCFIMSFKNLSLDVKKNRTKRTNEDHELADNRWILKQNDDDLKMVADIERKRDRTVLEILIEASELDRKYHTGAMEGLSASHVEGSEEIINLCQQDILSADAITLLRQNQALLCNFLVQRLQGNFHGEQHSMHEILMQCLLFLLHSATKLFCPPDHVVDIILKSAESFNRLLKMFYCQFKEGDAQLSQCKLHEVQRFWILLNRLVIASSGCDEGSDPSINARNGFRFANLIPPSAWLQKIPAISSSAFPLVRFFCWMAVSRNAKQYLKDRLFLVSDLSQLTYLLSIFSDELSLVDNIIEQKDINKRIEEFSVKQDINVGSEGKFLGHHDRQQSFHALYPDVSKFFPNLKKEFEGFGETILEAVGLQLKSLSPATVPEMMCWFSDLCSWPFVQNEKPQFLSQKKSDYFKGFVAKNAKAIVLYMLEAIVAEHMEAMLPEIPRVVQVLGSLCRTSYCDVSFLDSILSLLKPIISYSLRKVADGESLSIHDSCLNFESLCFGELFDNIRYVDENQRTSTEKGSCRALTIFILASIFRDLSFHRKLEVLQSTMLWADFASYERTSSLHDYICAYQVLMENCKDLLIGTLRVCGVIPLKMSICSDASSGTVDDFSKTSSGFLSDICNTLASTEVSEMHRGNTDAATDASQNIQLTLEEINSFSKDLEALISKLNPTIDQCWKIHHKLAKKLILTSAECFFYLRCLCFVAEEVSASSEVEKLLQSNIFYEFPDLWRTSLKGLSEMILVLQKNHCWEVASAMLDSLLGLPRWLRLDNVVGDICTAIKNFSNSAPKIAWRLQADKLLSLLLARGIHNLNESEVPLIDLFSGMIGHPEPEQRYIALKHLGRLAGQDVESGRVLSSTTDKVIASSDLLSSASEPILSALVSATWDQIALMASSDASMRLKTHATALLIAYIPFTERQKLQSFLAAVDSILQCLTTLAELPCDGPLTQFSLALIASVCLYSPVEDLSLIPESIWRNIETFGLSGNGRYCTGIEKKACEALCRLKTDGDEAKQILKEVLSSSVSKQQDPDFVATRESILQVIANLTSTQSYLEFFAKEVDQKDMELEEAEMEMELLQKECPQPDTSSDFQDWRQLPFLSTYAEYENRVQQIKDGITHLEKEKLKKEIVARRQQKLLVRRVRQQFLEEAAVREAELLQKLDSERTNEVESELERQRLLELERAKTRELRHNLDMEKEKQTQRELQRELEQRELVALELVHLTGMRPSRREFSSSTHSRLRDRYRERENGRAGNEGSLRATTGNLQPDTVPTSSAMGSMPTVVLSGNRQFSGQLPTILQSRDRSDECGSNYDETFDVSKDPGDTGSIGDPDISGLEGQSIGFGSAQRQGSRGGKTRQVIERRERGDGRREGKWERKH